jgi:3-methyladenine DNA glycosylase AlkD
MTRREIVQELKRLSNPEALEGMARYGIETSRAYGVSIPSLRALARRAGRDHRLARELWASRIHEARILASMIDDPARVSERQAETWVRDFNSWDLCDQCCLNLLVRTPFAWRKAVEWSSRAEEFVKRAGFVLMAQLSVHDREASDAPFLRLFPIIRRESADPRTYVKKAVNWALRQIGKRNATLNRACIKLARDIARMDSRPARWIAADALRELSSAAVQDRLRAKASAG